MPNDADLNARLKQLRIADAEARKQTACPSARQAAERRIQLEWKHSYLAAATRGAGLKDYLNWLRGYMTPPLAPAALSTERKPTHYYDYRFNPQGWLVALTDLMMRPLYGADAVHIIIPAGRGWEGDPGHSHLYLMDGFREVGGWVPCYTDVEF